MILTKTQIIKNLERLVKLKESHSGVWKLNPNCDDEIDFLLTVKETISELKKPS
jgi:hypothetical protein